MSLDTIRLSQPARDQLIKLKRITGIKTWNILCRWALAISLSDASTPLVRDIVPDSNLEMSWKTFSGEYGDVYLALIKHRCVVDGEEPSPEVIEKTFSIHLHRGIAHLAGRTDLETVSDMLSLAFPASDL
ncbi:DNA sulfur modification protein DndE [Planomonospora sp. ID82291]|uniref:DNA sulfur modification protein DndE n=1 Tax=Planomonospora sp. ID82291 TaxID=2738136 RepID=UPI0018C447E7|nr:DNA sulfur modification protein DndE [Planomonospora sp. ID82291]MBG0814640.1 DNA sulfur modification protein DndE [Planomonospora sp. ID82291]